MPSHALMRIFSTMKSPGRGSSPATGAAPQEPRTSALESTRPSNSGAFSVRPGAPGSTMNQTWITTTPRARAASASRRTLSTTRCARACAGAPESAKAPPSMMTSFCRSWMISAQRFGSSCRPSALSCGAGAEDAVARRASLGGHVRLVARPDLGRDRVNRVRRGHEQRPEVGAAPAEIGDQFGHANLAQEIAVRRIDPDAARRRHPDIAELIAFHAVRQRRARVPSGCRWRRRGRWQANRRRRRRRRGSAPARCR